MKATQQYAEMAKNQEARIYTIRFLHFLHTYHGYTFVTYNIVEDYWFRVYRKADPRFSIRTVERKMRELAEEGYLERRREGKTYAFYFTPKFHQLVLQLGSALEPITAKGAMA